MDMVCLIDALGKLYQLILSRPLSYDDEMGIWILLKAQRECFDPI